MRSSVRATVLATALATSLTTALAGAAFSADNAANDAANKAADSSGDRSASHTAAVQQQRRGGDAPLDRTKHSSDGVRGKVAPQLPLARKAVAPVDTAYSSFPVAPGLYFQQWDRIDARGNARIYLLTAYLDTPGLGVDYLGADEVRDREVVLDMVTEQGAVAGINGDFFDIADTGAPLGIGADRARGLIHGRVSGWNRAFYLTKEGVPDIGDLEVKASIKGRPELHVTTVNSPTVEAGRVGIYTRDWGHTVGGRVVDGQRQRVREVVIRKGRVVRNRGRLSDGAKIRGTVLIGRDKGAKRLARLRVGTKVKVKYRLAGRPQVALTGNRQLVDERIRTVVDDKEMHPRTAIGIDRDINALLLLVVDGRQSFSRGYTMVELANLMIELGAEDALNLDGGGSSTMAGLRPDGTLGVFNSPSDGRQRPVPDGLQLRYAPPVAKQ